MKTSLKDSLDFRKSYVFDTFPDKEIISRFKDFNNIENVRIIPISCGFRRNLSWVIAEDCPRDLFKDKARLIIFMQSQSEASTKKLRGHKPTATFVKSFFLDVENSIVIKGLWKGACVSRANGEYFVALNSKTFLKLKQSNVQEVAAVS